ncbi:putative membrane protein [Natranaerovirga hydrolytica]|uniref:Putative membrane protein n=1 Tax=Natranaerovirga hydrolytica TaxID=680378 RepID=A0A4R1MKY7_9FIRM|nr:SHOCT domain-containing protein [Natranaerovirga hydrolytica]TCK92720.1 putative membrane protein [Natranaerovirga hydrolytica]
MWYNWTNGANSARSACGFGFGGGMFGMGVFWLIIIGIIIFLIFKDRNKENNQAQSILKERFAKGELTEEEFQVKSKYLK